MTETLKKTMRNRACAVCWEDERLLVVWLKDPGREKSLPFPPGGSIEAGESAAAAAEREAWEETGFRVKVDPSRVKRLRYDFEWNHEIYDCETEFFAATLVSTSPDRTPDPRFLDRVEWMPLSEVNSAFAFHSGIRECVMILRG